MLNNIQNGWRPATIKLGLVALVASCIFFVWPATAEVFKLDSQWTCGKTEELAKELRQVNEEIIMAGVIDDVVVFTLWANHKTRTFTAVATPTSKPEMSCIIVHGNKMSIAPPKNMV
jgi:hypothetical protein